MKKLLLCTLIAGISIFTCSAQTATPKTKFSFGIEGGVPVGNSASLYNFGIGGSVKAEIHAGQDLYVTLSGGYTNFPIKDEVRAQLAPFGDLQKSAGFIPVKVGLKYYIENGFFGEVQIGKTIATTDGAGSAFAYAPGFGYTFDSRYEIGLRYEGWRKDGSTFGQFGLRLAIRV